MIYVVPSNHKAPFLEKGALRYTGYIDRSVRSRYNRVNLTEELDLAPSGSKFKLSLNLRLTGGLPHRQLIGRVAQLVRAPSFRACRRRRHI